jgi:hypothetical protein
MVLEGRNANIVPPKSCGKPLGLRRMGTADLEEIGKYCRVVGKKFTARSTSSDRAFEAPDPQIRRIVIPYPLLETPLL